MSQSQEIFSNQEILLEKFCQGNTKSLIASTDTETSSNCSMGIIVMSKLLFILVYFSKAPIILDYQAHFTQQIQQNVPYFNQYFSGTKMKATWYDCMIQMVVIHFLCMAHMAYFFVHFCVNTLNNSSKHIRRDFLFNLFSCSLY